MVPAVGVFPIDPVRIVKSQLETVLFAGIGQLLDDIPFRIGEFCHIIITYFAVPQGKAIMMLGGDGDIFHSCLFCQHYPFFRINIVPVETLQ